jgi:subtilisin family serine protease
MRKKYLFITTLFSICILALLLINSEITKGDSNPYKIISGEEIFPYTGNTSTVAVIDTGIQSTHPFLKDADIHQFYLDEISKTSQQYHGTMIAGIMLGKGTDEDPFGLIPSGKVISIQAGTDMGMTSEQLASAIDLAVEEGAKVLNISFATLKNKLVLQNAVKRALDMGVVIVASNGNEKSEQDYYPASYEGVISVGAIDTEGKVLNPSDINNVDIFALGDKLKTIVPDKDSISQFEGNSAATPVVSSLVAIILAENPKLTPEQIENIIIQSSSQKKLEEGNIRVLNVSKAVKSAKGD